MLSIYRAVGAPGQELREIATGLLMDSGSIRWQGREMEEALLCLEPMGVGDRVYLWLA